MNDFVNKLIADANGKPSSRRISGFIIISLWLLLSISIIIYDIINPMELSLSSANILDNMGWIGFSLLGISVIEIFKKKNE